MVIESTKHPSRKVMNFRHLLGCDTIVRRKEILEFCQFLPVYHERVSVFTKLLHSTDKRNLSKVPRNLQS